MPRPIQATIHTAALRHNLARLRAAAPGARLWAIVKANAYGHGIERAYEGLRGADGFALIDLAEAERVRALGWRGPILLLEGVFEPRDLETCSRLNLWHTVHCDAQIDWLAMHKTEQPHRVFLKINTGMTRMGFPCVGAWTVYGLGTVSQNLPAFVVMYDTLGRGLPKGYAQNWGSGFLPSIFQGTALKNQGAPIDNLDRPAGMSERHQRNQLDLLHRRQAEREHVFGFGVGVDHDRGAVLVGVQALTELIAHFPLQGVDVPAVAGSGRTRVVGRLRHQNVTRQTPPPVHLRHFSSRSIRSMPSSFLIPVSAWGA